MGEFRYVLLCRHAGHDDGQLLPVRDANGVLRFPTESVSRVLAEELVIGRDALRLAKVVYAPTPEASRTAKLLLQRLEGKPRPAERRPADENAPTQPDEAPNSGGIEVAAPVWLPESDKKHCLDLRRWDYDVPCESCEELLPNRLSQTTSGAGKRIDSEIEGFRKGRNALLIVGHQPQMGWLSSHLSADRPGGRSGAVPLAASEVVCLRLRHTKEGWRGSLCWTLAPGDRKALDAVSDKVKGKMESAKLLSAVITLALTALLGVCWIARAGGSGSAEGRAWGSVLQRAGGDPGGVRPAAHRARAVSADYVLV